MRTIGTHWPESAPLWDYVATCDICGVKWRRSGLQYDSRGFTVCPKHGRGADPVELTEENAQHALEWARELAEHPTRDRGGEYGPERIARDPRVIFSDVLFDVDATTVTANAAGLVTSITDAAGSGQALTPSVITGVRLTQHDASLNELATLVLAASVAGGMRNLSVSHALPVCYWGLAKVSGWFGGDPLVRSATASGSIFGCTFATGNPGSSFTVRDGVAPAGSVAGPGGQTWMRFFARFSAGQAELRIGGRSMLENVGSLPLVGLELRAGPGSSSPSWELHRMLVLTSVPTEAQLDEADMWVRSRAPGRVVFV